MKKRYFITTVLLDEDEFASVKHFINEVIDNWKAEPDDKVIFENDEMYKAILHNYFKAKKELENYKYKIRNHDIKRSI